MHVSCVVGVAKIRIEFYEIGKEYQVVLDGKKGPVSEEKGTEMRF